MAGYIRENITPRGDGNPPKTTIIITYITCIRENITPRGDGNPASVPATLKLTSIRENITPRGDGNIKNNKGW